MQSKDDKDLKIPNFDELCEIITLCICHMSLKCILVFLVSTVYIDSDLKTVCVCNECFLSLSSLKKKKILLRIYSCD